MRNVKKIYRFIIHCLFLLCSCCCCCHFASSLTFVCSFYKCELFLIWIKYLMHLCWAIWKESHQNFIELCWFLRLWFFFGEVKFMLLGLEVVHFLRSHFRGEGVRDFVTGFTKKNLQQEGEGVYKVAVRRNVISEQPIRICVSLII